MAKKVTKTENTESESKDLQNVNVVVKNEPKKTNEDIIPYTTYDIFELNQKIIAIEHLIKYYTNLAIANEGLYTHDTKVLYTNARKKIQSLECKKTEILLELEKRIL